MRVGSLGLATIMSCAIIISVVILVPLMTTYCCQISFPVRKSLENFTGSRYGYFQDEQ